MKTLEEYLREHSVLDGHGNMDGSFVPLSVAMIGCEQVLRDKLEFNVSTNVRFRSLEEFVERYGTFRQFSYWLPIIKYYLENIEGKVPCKTDEDFSQQ